jgi:hypothetical protein
MLRIDFNKFIWSAVFNDKAKEQDQTGDNEKAKISFGEYMDGHLVLLCCFTYTPAR